MISTAKSTSRSRRSPPPAPTFQPIAKPAEPLWHVAVASACGGVVEAVLQNPWRIVKNIQQVQTRPRSTLQTLAAIGPRRCMEGLGLNIGLAVQSNILFYSVQHLLVQRFARDKEHPSALLAGAAGAAAGAVEAWVTNPVRRVQVLQDAGHQTIAGMGPLHAVRTLARHEGIPSLWQGVGGAAARNAASIGTFFGIAALCRAITLRHGALGDLAVGAAAEAGAAIVSNPFDAVTTRMYATPQAAGLARTAHGMLVREGPRAFLAGATANILRLAPSTAADFATTSLVRRSLRKRQLSQRQ